MGLKDMPYRTNTAPPVMPKCGHCGYEHGADEHMDYDLGDSRICHAARRAEVRALATFRAIRRQPRHG